MCDWKMSSKHCLMNFVSQLRKLCLLIFKSEVWTPEDSKADSEVASCLLGAFNSSLGAAFLFYGWSYILFNR